MQSKDETDAKWQRWRKHFPRANRDCVADAGVFVVDDAPERIADAIRHVLATL